MRQVSHYVCPDQPEQLLPAHTSIVDAYNQAQEELLILGEPGAGKSTLLLELADHLVEQAEHNTTRPLPILVPLSTWAASRGSLQDWLGEQIALLYDVPRSLSRQWIQAELVLPLLDGLDEMEVSARAACIAAINIYHRDHLLPLVVCSRTNEYDTAAVHERLALHTAVVVQPLSREQVDLHLASMGKPLAALRTALKKNPLVQELATTPLLLQVLMLTYHGRLVRDLPQREAQLRQQIWVDFVQHMVMHKGNIERYSFSQSVAWLSWLARRMQQHDQTIFYPEQLQPDWLPARQRAFYRWSAGLFVGLLIWLSGMLLFWLTKALLAEPPVLQLLELVLPVVAGLAVGTAIGQDTKIEPAEALTWSWKEMGSGLVVGPGSGLVIGLIYGLLIGLIYGLLTGLVAGLLTGLVVVLSVALSIGVFSGFSGKQLTERSMLSPNEGIHRSLKFGLFLGLGFGLLIGLILGLVTGGVAGLFVGLGIGLLIILTIGFSSGLGAAVQHYTLRFWLWRTHLFPWQAVPFLEDATTRMLLRRVGGSYSFTHRLLMDYFADLNAGTLQKSASVQTKSKSALEADER